MTSHTEAADPAGSIVRDVVLGLVAAYVVTVGICLLALSGEVQVALVGALLPALFAGPFIGILLALRRFMAEQADAAAAAWELGVVHPIPVAGPAAPTDRAA